MSSALEMELDNQDGQDTLACYETEAGGCPGIALKWRSHKLKLAYAHVKPSFPPSERKGSCCGT